MPGKVAERSRGQACRLAAEIAREGIKVETVVTEGYAADEILKTAEEHDADLILITAPHKGIVEHVLLGTTAERVIREAHLPVLSIPPKSSDFSRFPMAAVPRSSDELVPAFREHHSTEKKRRMAYLDTIFQAHTAQ